MVQSEISILKKTGVAFCCKAKCLILKNCVFWCKVKFLMFKNVVAFWCSNSWPAFGGGVECSASVAGGTSTPAHCALLTCTLWNFSTWCAFKHKHTCILCCPNLHLVLWDFFPLLCVLRHKHTVHGFEGGVEWGEVRSLLVFWQGQLVFGGSASKIAGSWQSFGRFNSDFNKELPTDCKNIAQGYFQNWAKQL